MEQLDIFGMLLEDYKITKPIRLITLFSGYDSQKLAFDYINVPVEHYRTCEFDKYAIQSLNEIHNTNFETKDITKVNANELGIVDTNKYEYILTYSFPCTDLSLAGKRAGMDRDSGTRSGLLWEVERLLLECKELGNLPNCLIMENVPQVITANGWREWNLFLENLEYSNYCQVLNAMDFGIPQHRERAFMVSILGDYNYTFPRPLKLKTKLKDFLEKEVDKKYYLSDKKLESISNWKAQQDPLKDIDKEKLVSPTLTARGAGEEHSGMILINELVYNEDNPSCEIRYDEGIRTFKNGSIGALRTIDGCGDKYIIEKDKINVIGNYSPSNHDVTRIVHPEGIAPTVKENHGSVTAVIEEKSLFTDQQEEMITNDGNVKRYLNSDIVDEFKDGQIADISFPNGYNKGNRVFDNCPTLNTTTTQSSFITKKGYKIRKITPKECFKLMGVKPSDYEKITCSESQQYKQAGNSIVTTCLMAIYSSLFDNCDYRYHIEELLKELRTNGNNISSV